MKNPSKLVCVLLLVFVAGCIPLEKKIEAEPTLLPPGATDMKVLNDKWVSFSLNDQTYYFSMVGAGNNQTAILIPLSRKPDIQPSAFKCPKCGANIVVTEMGPVHVQQ